MDPKDQTPAARLGFDEAPPSVDDLREAGDADGLLELGAAYRAGTDHVPQSAAEAVRCFKTAAELGSEDGAYLAAVALLHGSGVPADLAAGAALLRQAAQSGHLKAKVFLANLYELGVHYKADPEKADVWYRAVARAAGLETAPGSVDQLTELAELGCARQCLELIADRTLEPKDRLFYLRKAKAHGYNLYLRLAHREKEAEREALLEEELERAEEERSSQPSEEQGAPQALPPSEPEDRAPEEEPLELPAIGSRWTLAPGLGAATVALFFAFTGGIAALLGVEGARVARHWPPVFAPIAAHPDVVGLVLLFAAGALPSAAVYRPQVLVAASVAGVLAAVGGFYAFEAIPSLWNAVAQAGGAGLGVFLLVAIGLGLVGGTRVPVRRKKPLKLPDRSHERLVKR